MPPTVQDLPWRPPHRGLAGSEISELSSEDAMHKPLLARPQPGETSRPQTPPAARGHSPPRPPPRHTLQPLANITRVVANRRVGRQQLLQQPARPAPYGYPRPPRRRYGEPSAPSAASSGSETGTSTGARGTVGVAGLCVHSVYASPRGTWPRHPSSIGMPGHSNVSTRRVARRIARDAACGADTSPRGGNGVGTAGSCG